MHFAIEEHRKPHKGHESSHVGFGLGVCFTALFVTKCNKEGRLYLIYIELNPELDIFSNE